MNVNSIPTANTYDGKRWVLADDYVALFEECHAEKKKAAASTERLRDRIAIKHLREAAKHSGNEDEVARACYRMADAMLKARAEKR